MRRRLLLVILATTSLVVIAFAVPLAALVDRVAEDRAITLAERDVASLAPVLAVTTDRTAIQGAITSTETGQAGRLNVWLPDGTSVGQDDDVSRESLRLAREQRMSFTEKRPGGLDLYTPVLLADHQVAAVRAQLPAELLDAGVQRAWLILTVIGVSLIIIAVLIADRLARSVTRGARQLAGTARSLAGDDPTARAATASVPELNEAAQALNLLADRIDELRSVERERVADLSHRLRTPMTALRLDAEAAGNPSLVDGVNRLEAAVTELIRNARRPLHETVDAQTCLAVAVVKDRCRFWGVLAEDDGRVWDFSTNVSSDTAVRLSHQELEAAVDVLLGNVFAHTHEGTAYRVVCLQEDSEVVITVYDNGPGINDVEAALKRGVTRTGSSGLGLDIARQAAEAAGGRMAVENGENGGAKVSLRLPIAT